MDVEVAKMDFKPSSFLFSFRKEINSNDVLVLYSSIKLKKLYFLNDNIPNVQKILNGDFSSNQNLVDLLYDNGLIVEKSITASNEINEVKKSLLNNPEIEVAYILPVTACNFSCKYCFVEGNKNYFSDSMDINLIPSVLEFIFNNFKSSKRLESKLVTYGGEPLLRKDLVFKIIEEAKRREKEINKKLNKLIISNGTNIDGEVCKYFSSNDIKVAISLDGPKHLNDINRVTKKGSGTFDIAMKAITNLKKFKVPLTISSTITESNVDQLPEITSWIIKNVEPLAIGYNILIGHGYNESLANKTSKSLIKSFEISRLNGVYEDTMMRKLEAFVSEEPYFFNCAATGGQLVVDPKGRVGLCHGFYNNSDFFPLDIFSSTEEIKNNKVFLEWSKRTPFNMEECYPCEAIGICGGGCPYNVYLERGDIWGLDKFNCIHVKDALEWMIWDLYKIMEPRLLKENVVEI